MKPSKDRRGSARHAPAAGLLAALALALVLAWPPAAPAQPEPEIVYSAQRGDTMIGIGARLLERPRDWREVARINRLPDPNRIQPAQPIRIPVRLLRGVPTPATVLEAVGTAQLRAPGAADAPVLAGAQVGEGARIVTGDDGYVTLRLADGSTLRLQAATEAELAQARSFGQGAAGGHRALLRLLGGRVEALVTQITGGTPRFEVQTPQALVAVRGTDFRVGTDGRLTRSEVLTGSVDFAAAAGGKPAAATPLAAGFGAVSDGRRAEAPTPLLPAPDVAALPALLERVLVRLPLPPVAGARRYRVQVAADREFQRVAAEGVFDQPELRFGTLEDGDYLLRARAIDAAGLEGRDAVHAFRLKARPEPPATTQPAPRSKLPVGRVEFGWAAHPQARHYRLQLARSADFARPERSLDAVDGSTIALDGLAAGPWFWRVATVRAGKAGDDPGPWGDPQAFELRPLPQPPAPPRIDAERVRLAWGAEPGQRFEFQLARDAAFADLVLERALDAPELVFERPAPGSYYLRYRAIDPDGYVGPYIAPQVLALYNCVRDSGGRCVGGGADALRTP